MSSQIHYVPLFLAAYHSNSMACLIHLEPVDVQRECRNAGALMLYEANLSKYSRKQEGISR